MSRHKDDQATKDKPRKLRPRKWHGYTEPPQLTITQSRAEAQRIAFAPMMFQAARAMLNLGIFKYLRSADEEGALPSTIAEELGISLYGVRVLLDMGLSMGVVWLKGDHYVLSDIGLCLLSDPMTRVNIDFVHDVCYQGMFFLEQAIREERPAGLQVFGEWPTIYEALSALPAQAQKSWFAFDHFYSDRAFEVALPVVFAQRPKRILDIGGNTGKWAMECVKYDPDVRVIIVDLPAQIATLKQNIVSCTGAERIETVAMDILDPTRELPKDCDAIWMSQFLDCFSEQQIAQILHKVHASMGSAAALYILETYWDRQPFEAAAFCLNSISLYFTCMANGNSRMYHSGDMIRLLSQSGFRIDDIADRLGIGHTLIRCRMC